MPGIRNALTNWQNDEMIFTTASAKDIKLLWKLKLDVPISPKAKFLGCGGGLRQ
jgi:hypothetical protein